MRIDNAVASFPQLFQPTKVKGSDRARYGVQILIPPDHPQLNEVWQEFENVKNAGFPSGLSNRATVCFGLYEQQVDNNKDYFDPRFRGWYMLSAYSPGDKARPTVVMEDANGGLAHVMDPSKPFSGELMHFHVNIYTFTEGNTGVACGLNGVCLTGVEGPMGRLDNRPTAEQMFGKPVAGSPTSTLGTMQSNRPPGVGTMPPAGTRPLPQYSGASAAAAPPPQRTAAPPPPQRNAPPPPVPVKRMTAKAVAEGYTYEALKGAQWTDQDMIDNGYLEPPAGVTASFQ